MKPLPQIKNLVAFTAWTSIIADGNNITSKTKNKDFKSLPLCGPFLFGLSHIQFHMALSHHLQIPMKQDQKC